MFYMNSNDSVESIRQLAAYHNKNGVAVDWMHNGIVLYSMNLYLDAVQTECEAYIGELFQSGGTLEQLNALIGTLKTSLNDSSYKFNVFIAIPYAGDISNGNMSANIQTIVSNWNSGYYPNLELSGFYWGYTETFDMLSEIRSAATLVHGYGLKMLIIPYSGSCVDQFNYSEVDFATQQPNYMISTILSPANFWFERVNYNILTNYITGAELELTDTTNGVPIDINAMHYLGAVRNYKWNDRAMTTYYQYGHFAYYATSPDPNLRLIYDDVYRYSSSKLRGEWKFYERSGNTVTDSSENTNNGTVSGAAWSVDGIGGCMNFDGVNDYVSIPDNSTLDVNGALTVEAWIKPLDTSTWHAIISRNEYGKRLLLAPNANIQAAFGGNPVTTTSSSVIAGEWNHVVYVSNNVTGKIFVNGVCVMTGNAGANFSSSKTIYIGKTTSNYYPFYGGIDNVRVYSRCLSDSEIVENYQNGKNKIGLVAHWSFRENMDNLTITDPSLNPLNKSLVFDSSENMNDGEKAKDVQRSGEGIRGSLYFDGVDDYVRIPDTSSLDISGKLTVSAWIKPEDISTWHTIFSRDEYCRRLLLAPNGNVQADFGVAILTTNTSPVVGNAWNHVVYVSDGDNGTIYVNGTAVLSGPGGAVFASGYDVFIGKTTGGYYPFKGMIDEVKVYARALPALEILQEYGLGLKQIEKSVEWKFDESSGAAISDTSENYNTGIIFGAQRITGISGNALSFDGIDDYIKINGFINPNTGLNDNITVEAWVKPNNLSAEQTVFDRVSITAGGGVKAESGNGICNITSGMVIKQNQWNQIIYTSDGTSNTIFVNGEMQSIGTGNCLSDLTVIGNNQNGTSPFAGESTR